MSDNKNKAKHIWKKPANDKKKVVWSSKQYQDYASKGKGSSREENHAATSAKKKKSRAKKTKVDTNKFTKLVEATLNKMGYNVWRNNTAGVYNVATASQAVAKFISSPTGKSKLGLSVGLLANVLKGLLAKHFMQVGGKKGVSDIIGTERGAGRSIYVEIKTGNDKESKHQESFRLEMIADGAIAFVLSDQEINWRDTFPIQKALEEKLKPFKDSNRL